MCNAWNHRWDCDCGWGGGSGSGGNRADFFGSVYAVRPLQFASGLIWRKDRHPAFDTYTTPNAKCPVCGESVFFYQSPYGGRVFFDELGPPWPKHPCTDNYFAPTNKASVIFQPSNIQRRQTLSFQQGWKPLTNLNIEDDSEFLFFTGNTCEPFECHAFGLRSPHNINFDGPLYCRKLSDGRYEISWIPSSFSYNHFEIRMAFVVPHAYRPSRVEEWEKAAAGDAAAQNMVGMMLTFHRDSEMSRKARIFPEMCDWAAARMWFEAAAEMDYWAGIHNLGVMYLNGYGVEKNGARAFEFFSQAAQSLSPISLRRLADCYEQGIGTLSDLDMTAFLRELADISDEDED
ncbi:hypothetical protein PS647_04049 [Pseudomonas fluorescens]|nr:hypothetical protein PS647_04049 [Pseudomonas fluorescens]